MVHRLRGGSPDTLPAAGVMSPPPSAGNETPQTSFGKVDPATPLAEVVAAVGTEIDATDSTEQLVAVALLKHVFFSDGQRATCLRPFVTELCKRVFASWVTHQLMQFAVHAYHDSAVTFLFHP